MTPQEEIAALKAHIELQDDDIAMLLEQRKELLEALKGLHDDIMDYIRLNNLGGENNHWLVIARAAIAKAQGEGK